MRLLQGLSVGGEYATSSILLVERSPVERRGFLGSLAALGSNTGFLLGSAVGAVVTTLLDRSAVMSWGWRVPFLAGSVIGIFGFWIRRRLADDDREPEHGRPSSPVRDAFRTEWRSILPAHRAERRRRRQPGSRRPITRTAEVELVPRRNDRDVIRVPKGVSLRVAELDRVLPDG